MPSVAVLGQGTSVEQHSIAGVYIDACASTAYGGSLLAILQAAC